MKRLALILLSAIAVMLAAPVFAGGWAVVTLDELPGYAVAGEPLVVTFAVRQHGNHLMGGLEPKITLRRIDEPKWMIVNAVPQRETGHYSAILTFPAAGVWRWEIDAFGAWPQVMPELTVLAAGSAAPANEANPRWPMTLGVLGVVGVLAGVVVLVRTRTAWAATVVLVAALVGTVGFASARGPAAAPAVAPAYTPAQLGQRLFIAKGCVVCHNHEAVAEARKNFDGFEVGPNLTHFSTSADYLAKWLDDPKAVKPQTEMPKLDLSDEEIGALAAFINEDGP
jgi:mono/diheme cytochrome c family protein